MTINNSQLGYNTGASEYNIYKTNATVDALLKSNNNVAIKNSIIISSPVDENSYDIKKPAILMTDNNGYFLPLTYSMNTEQFNYSPNSNSVQLNSSYIDSVIFSENSTIQNFPVSCKTQIFCYYTSMSKDINTSGIAQQIIHNTNGKNKQRIHLGETIGITESYYNKNVNAYYFSIIIDPINIKKEKINFSNSIGYNIITNEFFDENHISLIKYTNDYANSKNNTIYFLTLIPTENIDRTSEFPKTLEFVLYDDERNFEKVFKYKFAIAEQNNNKIFISNYKVTEVSPTGTATATNMPTATSAPTNTPSNTHYIEPTITQYPTR